MTKSRGAVVSVVPQRRRNRQFMALQVAPKSARPQALRDLYLDAGTRIRRAVETPEADVPAAPQTSR
ncbi:hypothetical protein [Actinophytocola sp.]|uniref:hypothetical protein n=1 Tax=Actinophytocola sp. TaxID=1872138 RepID=UPI003D6B8877